MSVREVTRLVPRLNVKVKNERRRFRNNDGPLGRLKMLQITVNGLIEHERLELNFNKASEARPYVERLITDAIRFGDCHKATMEMANFWLPDKRLIHKLFKVLAPRYENYTESFTNLHIIPTYYWERFNRDHIERRHAQYMQACLELKENPFPPVKQKGVDNKKWIHNVLLDEAKKAYRYEKYKEAAERWAVEDPKAAANAEIFTKPPDFQT